MSLFIFFRATGLSCFLSVALALILTACGGGGGGVSSTAVQQQSSMETITISGLVTDDVIPEAELQFFINGIQLIQTKANNAGQYTAVFDVDSASDGLLKIIAVDPARPHVRLISLTGTGDLIAAKDDAGLVVAARVKDLNITNITTAAIAIAESLNDGQEIKTYAELQIAREALKSLGDTIKRIAAMIKVIVDVNDALLPQGINDVSEFAKMLTDKTVRDQFYDDHQALVDEQELAIIKDKTLSSQLENTIADPAITTLTVDRTTISVGDSVALTAVFTDGSGVIDQGLGAVVSDTVLVMTPAATTTYELSVTNAADVVVTSSITVTVVALPSISSFIAAAETISTGDSVALTAVFADGAGVIDNATGKVTSDIALVVTPTVSTTYTLSVTNAAGVIVTSNVTVTVVALPSINSFIAATATISVGDSTTLTASFSGGAGVIDNDVGTVTTELARIVSPTETVTYTLSVTNAAGIIVTSGITVIVVALPVISSFTAETDAISSGESTTLTAVFSGGSGVVNDDVTVADILSEVAQTVSPTETTTYLLTVSNAAGDAVTLSVAITVIPSYQVQISWNQNPETAVNRMGGGYKVYYSSNSGFEPADTGVTEIDVPFEGGMVPTSTQLKLFSGTYYIRIAAYSALNASAIISTGSISTATDQIELVVP